MNKNASPLMYRSLVALDRQRHAQLRLGPAADLACAADCSVLPLLAVEFAHAAREYPVVFVRGAGQELMPVAVTGTPEWRNVFVDSEGRWDARYVPAYARRYPFVFARTEKDELAVCIDEACPRFSADAGTPLFQNGEPSALLQEVLAHLGEYERQAQFTSAFMKRLEASGVLVEANARAELAGRSLAVRGFWVVDEARFRALPAATVQEWFASGELGLVQAHLISLGNLLQILNRRPTHIPRATDNDTAAHSVNA